MTSDGGLILVRELDEQFGLSGLIGKHLVYSRTGRNTQFPLADLLRQSVYSRLAGYEDLNDAAWLSADPTFRLIGAEKIWERGAALTSTLHWFETDLLAREENLTGLARLNRELVAQAENRPDGSSEPPKRTARAPKRRHCGLALTQEGAQRNKRKAEIVGGQTSSANGQRSSSLYWRSSSVFRWRSS